MKKNAIIFLLLLTVFLFGTGAASLYREEGRSLLSGSYGNILTLSVAGSAFDSVFILTEQPQSVNVELDQKVTFRVAAVGEGLTYKWYYRRPYGDWKEATAKGHDTASLIVTAKKKIYVPEKKVILMNQITEQESQFLMRINNNKGGLIV